jgi:fucose permease
MGVVVAGYGPLLEHLTRRFGVSLPVAGATISVNFTGGLIGVLVAMRFLTRVPGRSAVMAGLAFAAAGCVGAALAPVWYAYVASVLMIGLGFGALVISLNQLVAYSEGRRRAAMLNGLNAAYSAGAVISPILVAAFARSGFPVLYLGAAIAALALIPASAGISGRLPVAAGTSRRPSVLVWVFICAFVFYVGVENGAGGWITSHMESTGLSADNAARATSAFWLALVTGRLLMTVVPARVPEKVIVLTCSAVATLSLLAAGLVGPLAPVAYVVTGLALAPIFPTGVVWLARLRPGDARATAWLFPATSVGGITGPGLIGLMVAGFGLRWVPVVLAVLAGLMSLSFWLAGRQKPAAGG